MNYLLNIVNIFLIFIFIFLIFKPKKTLYAISVFLLTLALQILLINSKIDILNYNILPILLELTILSLVPIIKKKKTLIIYSLSLIPLDILTKLSLSILLNIPFIELNQPGYYYFSSYLLIITLFIKITLLIIIKLIINYQNQKEIKYTTLFYLIQLAIEFIGFIIINYSLVTIVFTNKIIYPTLITVNLIYIFLFMIIILLNIILQKISITKEKQLNKYKEESLLNTYQNIYIASQEELFKLRHDIANTINSIKTYNNETKDIIDNLSNKLKETKIIYTNNKIINAILVNKIKEAKENDIIIETNINIQKEISLSNNDIISLLTNLIDNSINAVKYTEDKIIKLEIISIESLDITIKNAYNDQIKIKKDHPQYHGFGLKIIKEIVNKNKGNYLNQKTNNYFFTHISIPY